MNELTNKLIKNGYLEKDNIIEAFANVDRTSFVSEDFISEAYADIPLPIGYGQTISQPSTVAFMLELLEPEKGNKILDIGSGSGWTTALLAFIVGEKGKVIALERISELIDFGKKNVEKFNYVQKGIVEFYNQGGEEGFENQSPYDRILISAQTDNETYEKIRKQLKVGGKMVVPINGNLYAIHRKNQEEYEEDRFPGFSFVPFVK